MTTLTENIINRVDKLPKPSNYAQALQPIFEAISNSHYAISDRFDEQAVTKGQILLEVENLKRQKGLHISVRDNGVGMDTTRFEAFCEVDTDYKKEKGGKGVGRLFWLDSFEKINVTSRYGSTDPKELEFNFRLRDSNQIEECETPAVDFSGIGTQIKFSNIRSNEYAENFPKREDTFLRYFASHFISDFLMDASPEVIVTIDGTEYAYPSSVRSLVLKDLDNVAWTSQKFGEIEITGFLCDNEASAGLDGKHQVHLLADGRTVETRKIDGLLGLGGIVFEERNDLCIHVCVDAPFLNSRVNEGRTAFNIPEARLKELTREVCDKIKDTFLRRQISSYKIQRAENYRAFIERYPIYDFDDPEQQLDRVPFGANEPEEFAAGLVKIQVRREEERHEQLQKIVEEIDEHDFQGADFAETIVKAAEELQRSEELSLAQHVVRRKLVLELLDVLLRRYREVGDNQDHYLERTVHSVLCPTSVSATDSAQLTSRRHDLWVVDERLTFGRAFASDRRIDGILAENSSALRPDLIVWDLAYGLSFFDGPENDDPDISNAISEMMVIELKRPMRKSYKKVEDNVEQQVLKYINQLKSGEIEGFSRDRVRVKNDCVFHCFIVADIVGDLKDQIGGWAKTADGEGRYRLLEGDHRGSITVVQWKDLINDAWMRNQATLNAAGLRRTSKLITEMQQRLREGDEVPQ